MKCDVEKAMLVRPGRAGGKDREREWTYGSFCLLNHSEGLFRSGFNLPNMNVFSEPNNTQTRTDPSHMHIRSEPNNERTLSELNDMHIPTQSTRLYLTRVNQCLK